VLTASLLYSKVNFRKKYLYELLLTHGIWKDPALWNDNLGKIIHDNIKKSIASRKKYVQKAYEKQVRNV